MQLVQVYDYACMRVAVRENITNVLLNYPKGIHVNELSKIISIEPKKLGRLMRLLATRGCYNEGKVSFIAWLDFISESAS
jgi:hypothetical protein